MRSSRKAKNKQSEDCAKQKIVALMIAFCNSSILRLLLEFVVEAGEIQT
jgi:hypothetical protein